MAGGRPSKYDPAFCESVIECLGEGHSVTAFAGRIGVNRSSVFEWAKNHPEFSNALKIGQAKAVEFWEKILAKVAKDGGGNATAVIFALKNRASDDWADKIQTELTGKDGGAVQIEQVTDSEAARAMAFVLARGAQGQERKDH
jgi:hypothetical protein